MSNMANIYKNKKPTMSITYNNIIKKFSDIAVMNPFISRFGAGQINDVEKINDGAFPVLWVVPQSADFDNSTLTYRFRVMVFDIDQSDDSLQQEILSDTLQILIDVKKVFQYDTDYDYTVDETTSATPFTERFVDYTTGWFADIDVITDLNNNPCNIPE